VLAFGLGVAGYFVGQMMYNAKVAINVAEVKGLAERRVEADTAYWQINYTVSGAEKSQIPALYATSERDQSTVVALLKENGFTDNEIALGVISYSENEFRNKDQEVVSSQHILRGSVAVETQQVKLVAKVRSKLNRLVAQGLNITNNPPAYYFSKLNDIKPEMLREATQNARVAANEFATNAGVTVGGIRSARQGGFIIRDVGENYGDTRKIGKEVRVVTTITFYLEK